MMQRLFAADQHFISAWTVKPAFANQRLGAVLSNRGSQKPAANQKGDMNQSKNKPVISEHEAEELIKGMGRVATVVVHDNGLVRAGPGNLHRTIGGVSA
jgi:hypothetical protein